MSNPNSYKLIYFTIRNNNKLYNFQHHHMDNNFHIKVLNIKYSHSPVLSLIVLISLIVVNV